MDRPHRFYRPRPTIPVAPIPGALPAALVPLRVPGLMVVLFARITADDRHGLAAGNPTSSRSAGRNDIPRPGGSTTSFFLREAQPVGHRLNRDRPIPRPRMLRVRSEGATQATKRG